MNKIKELKNKINNTKENLSALERQLEKETIKNCKHENKGWLDSYFSHFGCLECGSINIYLGDI